MNTKPIFKSLLAILIFSLAFWYSLVFSSSLNTESTEVAFILSDNMYLDSLGLRKNKVIFKSTENLKDYKIKSDCDFYSNLSFNEWNYYLFDIKFFDNKCESNKFTLINDKNEVKYNFNINLISKKRLYSKMIDLKSNRLIRFRDALSKKISENKKYIKYDNKIEMNYYTYLKKNRLLKEHTYNFDIINNILLKRKEKYLVPVEWHKMPTNHSKIPNSWRWYRSAYTDGIHHWWDINAKLWANTIALDDAIVVRVVNGFKFSDLSTIDKTAGTSDYTKIKNLDILRWNQVWLKTMSWDVVMYSHLTDIFSNIKVWEFIRKWEPIWTIWITGVPDRNYTDYHLHFTVHRNPFNLWKNEEYDLDDYMEWDWLFKWKTHTYILNNWKNYFEN